MRQQIKIAAECAAIALTAFLMLASFGWLMDGEPIRSEEQIETGIIQEMER